jgi:hypothetical protein
MKDKNVKKTQDLFTYNAIKSMYAEMEKTYVRRYTSGYRRMLEDMYSQWMNLLKTEPNK